MTACMRTIILGRCGRKSYRLLEGFAGLHPKTTCTKVHCVARILTLRPSHQRVGRAKQWHSAYFWTQWQFMEFFRMEHVISLKLQSPAKLHAKRHALIQKKILPASLPHTIAKHEHHSGEMYPPASSPLRAILHTN